MAKAFITASGTWAGVSTDGSPITVECIGGGGGGHPGDSNVGTGAGGGAYAVKTVSYVSGASVTVVVGAGGAGGASPANGGDTDFDSGTIIAKGGQAGQGGAGGTGGAAASCTPATGAFSGGDGGGIGMNSRSGAGGGGAAGPNGNGKAGGDGGAASPFNGGGGGGAGGGSSTAGGPALNSNPSGAGGDAQDGTAGPAGVNAPNPGTAGTHGAGGSGGGGDAGSGGGAGGNGGPGVEFDATHGAGGGAGGGGGVNGGTPGAGGVGGAYGGGGGGGGWSTSANGGAGGQGLIVVTYTPGGSTITLTPGAGSLTLTPGTPIVSLNTITLAPGAGALALTPGTPTVTLDFITLSPGAGTIALAGGTPTVALSGGLTLTPGAGAIVLTGATPGVFTGTGIDLHPTPGVIVLTGAPVTLGINLFPGTANIRLSPQAAGVTLVRTVGTGNQLYIGSTLYRWHESTFRITKTLSGEWSASFDLDYFGGSRPVVDQEVAMFWNSVKRFGGLVQRVREVGIQGGVNQTILRVTVGGFNSLVDRVIYAKLVTTELGTVTGEMVYNFWYEKLRQFGVTKIGDSPPTATDQQLFHYVTGSEVLNKIREYDPGYDWWIDDDKLLHYEDTSPIAPNAPFTIRNGDTNSDFMEVEKSNVRFRNRQFVLPTSDLQALRDDQHTVAVSGETEFATDYPLSSKPIVKVDGGRQLVVAFGAFVTGWQYYYIPGGIGVTAATAPGIGQVVDILYPSPYPVAEMAEDATSIALVGPYEAIWQAKAIYTRPGAQAMAQDFVDLFADGGFQIEVNLEYNSDSQPAWLEPGMVVDISRTFPTAVGYFTVEQVNSQEIELTMWRHSVVLRSGLGEVTEAQVVQQGKINARVPIDSPPYRLTAELFQDLPGITNPGASVGAIKNTFVAQCAGVVTSWDILFADDPPTGADFILDVTVNGVSIMPVLDTDKVVAAAGVATLQVGQTFLVNNTPIVYGDIVRLRVVQVGSTTPGKNCTFHLNIKVPANVGQLT